MNQDQLNKVGQYAELIGFETRINKAGYATFTSKAGIGKIRVDFEYNFLKEKFETHINWNADSTQDIEMVQEYAGEMNKAVSIAKKLREME